MGISTCLLGENVRYDGGHQRDRYLTNTLGRYFDWHPVCPEVEYGLSTPREAMRLVGTPDSARLVTIKTKVDHTEGMRAWAAARMQQLSMDNLCGFIFKSNSPSSGMAAVKVYTESGMPVKRGVGIFAQAFMAHFPLLPVEEDGRLHDPGLRENFIERVFAYRRWQNRIAPRSTVKDLIAFHTAHKLLLMSHSPSHVSKLGKLVATAHEMTPNDRHTQYITLFMDALRLRATTKKQTNVLQHIMGYFKKVLTADQKQELLEVIDQYHQELTPLIVPLTLLKHYVRLYDEPYLKQQVYLNPHPLELMLRNHV